jgi:AraC-like DNA-binding protein
MVGFADLVRKGGQDPAAIVAAVGLDPACLTDVDRLISWQRAAMAMEIAAERLAMPSFGLAWAATIPAHFPNVGPVVLLSAFAETAEDWVRLAMQYWRYHTNAYCLQLLAEPGDADAVFRFWIEDFQFAPRQVMDLMLANTVRMARAVTGIDGNPTLVRFQHSRPADTRPHEELFRCPLEFDAAHDEILFDRAYLAYPSGGKLRPLRALIGWYIRHRISQMPIYDQTMKTTVALAIPSVIGTGYCNLDFVATSLGLSSKKLQRLLQQEDTSFSEVLEEVRRSMAIRSVGESTAPIAHVARLLDYSDTPPFTLAFRRWTGTSPRDFRNDRQA